MMFCPVITYVYADKVSVKVLEFVDSHSRAKYCLSRVTYSFFGSFHCSKINIEIYRANLAAVRIV
jgi:hypothetical protein